MWGNGEKWGKWGIIGGGRWKTYLLDHPSTKKLAKMGTNHSCRFPSAPRYAIMWLVWSRLTPPPSDLSFCRGTQWGTRTAPCHTLTHPTKLSLVSGRLDMQQNKKCGAIEGSHCSVTLHTGAGSVINFCCPHPHFPPFTPPFPPFSPISPHFSPFSPIFPRTCGSVHPPPHSPQGQGKVFLWGFGASLSPFFHKKSANSHSRYHFPPFFLLGAIFQRHYPLTSGSGALEMGFLESARQGGAEKSSFAMYLVGGGGGLTTFDGQKNCRGPRCNTS